MLHSTPIFLFFSLCWIAAADVNMTAWDNQIIWPPATNSTPAWTSTETRCNPTGQGHFAFKPNMSVSYEFTGTAIYIVLLRSNVTGVYTVSVDNGDPVLIDGYHAASTSICDQMLGRSGLAFGPHTATINVSGASPQADPSVKNVYLEIDGFMYTSSSNGSTSPPSATPTYVSKSSSKASAISSIVVVFIGHSLWLYSLQYFSHS